MLSWPNEIGSADFIVIACSLTKESARLINEEIFKSLKTGVRLINVSRGQIVDEKALVNALESGVVDSAALDVFEVEPLPSTSPLRIFDNCIFGSHNSSNTQEAVLRASQRAIESMAFFLKQNVD